MRLGVGIGTRQGGERGDDRRLLRQLGVLDEAIGQFALAYSKQTEQDHAVLEKARRSGRITVATEKSVL